MKQRTVRLVEQELHEGRESLGEPEPQDGVALDEAVRMRLGHSNDWARADVNARINRGILERQKKTEKEIGAAINPYIENMERAAIAISVIDAEFPDAKARAKELIAEQVAVRKRLKDGHLTQCQRCGFEQQA